MSVSESRVREAASRPSRGSSLTSCLRRRPPRDRFFCSQFTIPKEVREAQNWKSGQEFAFIPKGAGVLLIPVPDDEDLFGIAKGATITNYRDRKDCY